MLSACSTNTHTHIIHTHAGSRAGKSDIVSQQQGKQQQIDRKHATPSHPSTPPTDVWLPGSLVPSSAHPTSSRAGHDNISSRGGHDNNSTALPSTRASQGRSSRQGTAQKGAPASQPGGQNPPDSPTSAAVAAAAALARGLQAQQSSRKQRGSRRGSVGVEQGSQRSAGQQGSVWDGQHGPLSDHFRVSQPDQQPNQASPVPVGHTQTGVHQGTSPHRPHSASTPPRSSTGTENYMRASTGAKSHHNAPGSIPAFSPPASSVCTNPKSPHTAPATHPQSSPHPAAPYSVPPQQPRESVRRALHLTPSRTPGVHSLFTFHTHSHTLTHVSASTH